MKVIRYTRSLILGLVFSFLAIGQAGATLIGLSSTNPGVVYNIDPNTGAASVRATASHGASLTGLASLGDTLYASDIYGSGLPSSFNVGSIDPDSGTYTQIGDQDGSSNWHGLAGNESEELLYAIDINDGNTLKSMTPDGTVTTIGTGTGIDGRGMAYDDENDILYATGSGGLYTVDTTTGTSTLIGDMGFSDIPYLIGLAYDEIEDILYANVAGDGLYTLDVNTGEGTFVGANGVGGIDGLTWMQPQQVPEPATLALMGLGLAGIGFARQKKLS